MSRRTRKSKQTAFGLSGYESKVGKPFGGGQLKGNPKERRPFSRKHLIHIVLKSSHAKGQRSMLHPRNVKGVNRLVRVLAKRFGVEIKNYQNVGNHLHLLIKASHRTSVSKYLKSLSGLIPRNLLGCEKGTPLGYKFWDGRPFSKIIAAGRRSFQNIQQYFEKNKRQANKKVFGFDFFQEAWGGT